MVNSQHCLVERRRKSWFAGQVKSRELRARYGGQRRRKAYPSMYHPHHIPGAKPTRQPSSTGTSNEDPAKAKPPYTGLSMPYSYSSFACHPQSTEMPSANVAVSNPQLVANTTSNQMMAYPYYPLLHQYPFFSQYHHQQSLPPPSSFHSAP